jgi:hypothetical protein
MLIARTLMSPEGQKRPRPGLIGAKVRGNPFVSQVVLIAVAPLIGPLARCHIMTGRT